MRKSSTGLDNWMANEGEGRIAKVPWVWPLPVPSRRLYLPADKLGATVPGAFEQA